MILSGFIYIVHFLDSHCNLSLHILVLGSADISKLFGIEWFAQLNCSRSKKGTAIFSSLRYVCLWLPAILGMYFCTL